jgi:tryptophanyl-tRNA synthetase
MKRVLTGLQPTGVLTIGNYIGSIKQMISYQDSYESFIFVADLHALTVFQDVEELHKNLKSLIALYIACGIDPKKNTIYIQSENEYIPGISWILECNSYYGELSRMVQFKEKSKKNDNFSVGLLTYPALMAADILCVDTDIVPVGVDQKQHVEITRDIAIRFNNKYGETFRVPECITTKMGTKIMDLQDPTKKMSKTDDNKKGVITLLEEIDSVRKKIMGATTDSEMVVKFDMKNKPGISNLLNIYCSFRGMSIEDAEIKFKDYNYGSFKTEVADVVVEFLSDIQSKYKDIINSEELNRILDEGKKKTTKLARIKYEEMKKKVGLYR